jgi:hypothetical protein
VKTIIAWTVLVAVLAFAPRVAAALVAIVAALAVAIAAQPVLLAFTCGMVAGPRLTRTIRGWTA